MGLKDVKGSLYPCPYKKMVKNVENVSTKCQFNHC